MDPSGRSNKYNAIGLLPAPKIFVTESEAEEYYNRRYNNKPANVLQSACDLYAAINEQFGQMESDAEVDAFGGKLLDTTGSDWNEDGSLNLEFEAYTVGVGSILICCTTKLRGRPANTLVIAPWSCARASTRNWRASSKATVRPLASGTPLLRSKPVAVTPLACDFAQCSCDLCEDRGTCAVNTSSVAK